MQREGEAAVRRIDKAGVIHVHTRYSDGAGTVRAVARAAAAAGASFVLVTDHDTLAALHRGQEGWYDRRGRLLPEGRTGATLLLVGEEISPDDGHHFLALGLSETVSKDQPPASYVREVEGRGGLGFIAHPDFPAPERYPLEIFPWRDWSVAGYTGLEIWTYTVDWLTDVTRIWQVVASLLLPDRFVNGPFPETLARWDELLAAAWRNGRRVVGIGSLDAHGILYSYRRMFRTVRTHVLLERDWTGRVAEDKRAVLEALAEGAAYVAYDGLMDATGFWFTAECGESTAVMGGRLRRGGRPGGGKVWLRAEAPAPCALTLRTPAGVVKRAEGRRLEHATDEPGVYRVEAHLPFRRGLRPWIYSNPVYIF